MLEGLDKVDWASLSHAYGAATDVPDLLRDLASDNPEVRQDALHELYGNIWHQGTVYQATAFAIPFLIELLKSSSADRPGILGLLQALATGNSYLDVHQGMDWYHNERHTPEFTRKRQQELDWVRAAHAEVEKGTTLYLHLLGEADRSVRIMVPYLLGACVWHGARVGPALRSHLVEEEDPEVKAGMLLGLVELWRRATHQEPCAVPPLEERSQFLARLMEPHEPALVRMVAALAVAEQLAGRPCPDVLATLRETIRPAFSSFAELPWCQGGDALMEVSRRLQGQPGLRLQLLLEFIQDPVDEIRHEAEYALEDFCAEHRAIPREVVPALANLLVHPDQKMRKTAIKALGRVGSAAHLALDGLRAALKDDSAEVRARSGLILAKLGDERALPVLIKMLASSRWRRDALEGLKSLGPAAGGAVPHLRRLLRKDKDGQAQICVAQALGAIGPKEANSALRDLVTALRNPEATTGIAYALGMWGPGAAAAVPALLAVLNTQDGHTRRNVVRALALIGPDARSALPALIALRDDPDPSVRSHVAWAFWRIDSQADMAVSILMPLLNKQGNSRRQEHSWARAHAAEVLAEIGEAARPAVPLLRKLLTHDFQGARVQAAIALWRIEGQTGDALPSLLEELKTGGHSKLVLRCLGEMGPRARDAIPLLREIVGSMERRPDTGLMDEQVEDDEMVLAEARKALDRIGVEDKNPASDG